VTTRPFDPDSAVVRLERELDGLHRARSAVSSIVIGQQEVVDEVFIALLSGGHVLLESAPGLGKTLLVRTMGTVCGMRFSRIQFTPDLMPADITGTPIFMAGGRSTMATTRFQEGPIFAQMVLADEINRATPKTQSALLEAMQERTVTVAGSVYGLPRPFFVLATQNPIEMEGTYVLPEAQIDRFFVKVLLQYPKLDVLDKILDETTGASEMVPEQVMTPDDIERLQVLVRDVPIEPGLRSAVSRFVLSTQPEDASAPAAVRQYVRYGVSPRGAQAMILAAKAHALLDGRFNVAAEDLQAVTLATLRHRLRVNYDAEADGVGLDKLLLDLFERTLSARR
jgi:MoxR-like ATPase